MRTKSLVVQEMVLFEEEKTEEKEIWEAIRYGEAIFDTVK